MLLSFGLAVRQGASSSTRSTALQDADIQRFLQYTGIGAHSGRGAGEQSLLVHPCAASSRETSQGVTFMHSCMMRHCAIVFCIFVCSQIKHHLELCLQLCYFHTVSPASMALPNSTRVPTTASRDQHFCRMVRHILKIHSCSFNGSQYFFTEMTVREGPF